MTIRSKPGPETNKDLLAKLIREVDLLRREVDGLNKRIGKFTKSHSIPVNMGHIGLEFHQRAETKSPPSLYQDAFRNLEGAEALQNQHQLLLLILKDIDGALRDIRAAYSDIHAIRNDSDLRGEFKGYLDRK